MKHPANSYATAMRNGYHWLNMHGNVRARGYFAQAIEKVSNDTEHAVALHMRGVVERRLGGFSNAHRSFNDALRLAPADSVLAGRIKRDQGLCYLDQAYGAFSLAGKAFELLTESYNILRHQDAAEASTTLSCLGVYYDFIGDRAEALRLLRRGVRHVRGKHIAYEMNNRIRLAHASVLWRWVCTPRTLIAGIRTKENLTLLIEFVLLLVGGERLESAGKRGLANIQLIMTRR